jgi:anti-sigma regulatory factor (Ser/Thr protein kinase)
MTYGREPPAVLHRDYEGDPKTLRAARRDVVDWLAERGADEATLERAALIVSELSSNAIQNSPDLRYNLRVTQIDDDHVAISVRNRPVGGLPPAREQWHPSEQLSLRELSLRGRGLAIVDSLSEEVTIDHLDDELLVTARVRLRAGHR